MRLHEVVNKDRIEKTLLNYFLVQGNHTIDDNGYISIIGNCSTKKQTKEIMNIIPIKFKSVSDLFIIEDVPISSMHNFPTEIGRMLSVKKTFLDNLEELKNIKIDGTISFDNNHITSLNGIQHIVFDTFSCTNNPLISLEGSPEIIKKDFGIYKCKVNSLIGGPIQVGGNYDCRENPLTSLEGLSKTINGNLYLTYDRELPLLRIMLVNGLQKVKLWPEHPPRDYIIQVETIINNYLGKGRKGAIQCAAELTKAGFKGNARL